MGHKLGQWLVPRYGGWCHLQCLEIYECVCLEYVMNSGRGNGNDNGEWQWELGLGRGCSLWRLWLEWNRTEALPKKVIQLEEAGNVTRDGTWVGQVAPAPKSKRIQWNLCCLDVWCPNSYILSFHLYIIKKNSDEKMIGRFRHRFECHFELCNTITNGTVINTVNLKV